MASAQTLKHTSTKIPVASIGKGLVGGEPDVFLRSWRPDSDFEQEPPAKRARLAATTRLFEELCEQVVTAQQTARCQRQERDQHEITQSQQVADCFPLTFEDARSPSPTATTTANLAKASPHQGFRAKQHTPRDTPCVTFALKEGDCPLGVCCVAGQESPKQASCKQRLDDMHMPPLCI